MVTKAFFFFHFFSSFFSDSHRNHSAPILSLFYFQGVCLRSIFLSTALTRTPSFSSLPTGGVGWGGVGWGGVGWGGVAHEVGGVRVHCREATIDSVMLAVAKMLNIGFLIALTRAIEFVEIGQCDFNGWWIGGLVGERSVVEGGKENEYEAVVRFGCVGGEGTGMGED